MTHNDSSLQVTVDITYPDGTDVVLSTLQHGDVVVVRIGDYYGVRASVESAHPDGTLELSAFHGLTPAFTLVATPSEGSSHV